MRDQRHPSLPNGRPLGATERLIVALDKLSCMNFVMVAELSGAVSPKQLRAALDGMARQHPLLTSFIVDNRFAPSTAEVPLNEATALPEELWRSVEFEANQRFDTTVGPLCRCRLLHLGSQSDALLLTFHHSIGDATCGSTLIRHLIQALEEPPREAGPTPPPLEALLPKAFTGGSGVLHHSGFIARFGGRLARAGLPLSLPINEKEAAAKSKVRLEPRRLEPEVVSQLISSARAEDTTVHGALAAAMLKTVREVLGRDRSVVFGSPVDLRSRLEPPPGEAVALYVTIVPTVHRLRGGQPFWAMAREVRGQLRDAVDRGEAFSGMTFQNRLSAAFIGAFGERSTPLITATWPKGVGISNIGRVEFTPQNSSLEVVSIGFGASLSSFSNLAMLVATTADRMQLTFAGMAPAISRETLRAMADGTMKRLVDAAT